jgi:hypothetical protein
MLYFLLHDADAFHGRIALALAASWRRRTFAPVAALAADLAPAIAAFADRFRLTADERPLLVTVTGGTPFDRRLWRHLAGEVLLYAAADAPAIQTAAETLEALATPGQCDAIRQAHGGSRAVAFGGVPYRPGHAGLNDVADVRRLTDELTTVNPDDWSAAALVDVADDDRADELAFATECFAALRAVYEQARARNQVVVCEEI